MPELLQGPAAIAHLLRRAGFGPALATWATWSTLTYDDAVDRVLAELEAPPPVDPTGFDPYDLGTSQQLWLERMLHAPAGLAEKLTLFWHGHFATSDAKVNDPQALWNQYTLLRTHGAGSFRELVLGISRDVAMIRWLDGNANRSGHPNENYGRELQELFTLGIGNYTEQDIREVARAFTGWGSRKHTFVFRPEFHDAGSKTIHGQTGTFGGEEVIDILVAQPACARFLATKFLRFFSHPEPTTEEVEALATEMRANGLSTRATLATILRAPAFRQPARQRALVKSPVEFCIAALRAVGAETVPAVVPEALARMGQVLFYPPSVKGWPEGRAWMSSVGIVERLRAAQIISVLPAETERAGIAAQLVDVALQNEMPAATRTALEAETTPQGRMALLLGGPEFQVN
ncbi:MAG: DUF1800 domain-containing protein [Planctomycetota bacterium]|nr:DUF1800 domain-containing protein [Planctomycetota bacterium]